jgi:tetratricopeptide (TPR) repeat protein
MALFGWPQAHEDDAERAVRAALAILDAITALNRESKGPKLSARIGIHTGEAVVAAGGDAAPDVFGDASNLASRVQSAADSNTVVITAHTHQLVAGRFVVESLGNKDLKGIDEPVEMFRVIRPSGARGHLASEAVRGLTPFVGREDEMRTLVNRWERAREGEGQVVLISGEAGIGKSRLVRQFRERLAATPHSWIKSELSPYLQNTPFAPVADMIQQALGWGSDDSVEAKLAKLEQNLERVGLQPAAALPLLAPLLNLPVPEKYHPLQLPPEQQRKRLLATLTGWLFGMATAQPLVMVLEDVHWSDPSTLEFHQTNVEQGATLPLLLLYTTRPEFRAPWPMLAHHTQITLGRLRDRDVREMVHAVAARAAMTEQMVDAVTSRSSGVPLFAEELTRAVVESGGRGEVEDIPGTLHNSLTARLDRLGAAKEVAQIASVIGREFTYPLLREVAQMPERELQSALASLIDAELIYPRGAPPDASYIFKHALIRDAAYDALLKSRRKELHRGVAKTLVEKFPEVVDAQPAIIARHWTEASEAELALEAWQKAGDTALARHAIKEAEESYSQAAMTLKLMAESPERDARELKLLSALAVVLHYTKGYGAPERAEVTARARKLAEERGDSKRLYLNTLGSWQVALGHGDYNAASVIAEQTLELARLDDSRLHDTEAGTDSIGARALKYGVALAGAHVINHVSRYYLGDLPGSEEHFAKSRELYNAARVDPNEIAPGGSSYASWTAWKMGRVEVARTRMAEALAAADGHADAEQRIVPPLMAAMETGMFTVKERAALARKVIEMSEKFEILHMAGQGRIDLGRARAELGHPAEGVALIRQGIAEKEQTMSRLAHTHNYAVLAETQALAGEIDDALVTAEKAVELNPQERVDHPEAYRVRGEIRLRKGLTELAEQDFRKAIALSQEMSAKMLELGAMTSLARLLRDTERRDEARAMLAEIYNWFMDGFDTADLKDARALLEELSVRS